MTFDITKLVPIRNMVGLVRVVCNPQEIV